ncbi:methionyl-tRNA formyltransferase [Methanolobus bombayensis]|uniref:methionyl-tRNA formyltransferase n=1 Tax=Methanolobus bombayensis TaxID=38023 RepID=UPI001AE5BAD5|nr:formyltransferase family protein [Methanolobus bombayensis]MBP1908191.1 methionyl-tRNA formyltransferase [Methanolobus bombayensis]
MNKNDYPRIVYAGDRDISQWVLEFILENGVKPIALMVSDKNKATHDKDLLELCDYLESQNVLEGSKFRTGESIQKLKELEPDYIICVHFPYVVPKEVLEIPKYGVLNLHPAYLPYNRGWNTPTWAIYDGTPYGATLHFMNEGMDAGDIIHQKGIEIMPDDTADSLYQKVKMTEFELFKESWESLVHNTYTLKKQDLNKGTIYKKADIESIQFIDLSENVNTGDLIRLFRALTTSNIKESAYFEVDGKRYRIQIHIEEDR